MYILCAFFVNAALSSIVIKLSVYRSPLFTTTPLAIQPPKLKNHRTQNFHDALEMALVK
jgi:hypothetical protein